MARSYVREARKRVGPKKERVRPVIELLALEHADAKIALTFASPLELLVSVMLSAQTTDVNVNRVTEKLFHKYRRPEDYLAVPVAELERDIFQTGFFRQKAKSLRGTMKILIEEHDGQVPESFDELLRLPGVARKTANVVSAERGAAQGIVVDTHVRRISQRLGFTRQEDPVKIERDLDAARAARRLGAFAASADLARPPDLRRTEAALRAMPAGSRGPVPVEPCLTPAGVVPSAAFGVRRRAGRRRRRTPGRRRRRLCFSLPAARADRELLAEPADAPLAGQLDRLRVGEGQCLDDIPAHQVGLGEAGQLEDAAPDREHAPLLVGDDEARCRAPG